MKDKKIKEDILIIKNDIRDIKKDIEAIKNSLISNDDNASDTISGLKEKSQDLEKLQSTFKNAKENLSAIADLLKRPM